MDQSARLQKEALRIKAKVNAAEETARNLPLSAAICERIAQMPEFVNARRVGLFCGRPWEVDLLALWKIRPDAAVFPKAKPADRSMDFYSIEQPADLVAGYAGILEPVPLPKRRFTDWGKGDLVLVPGYLFDRDGARIGSGYGYYDRFLARHAAPRWGVCFGSQIAKEKLAQEPTDVRMDGLVWESNVSHSLFRGHLR